MDLAETETPQRAPERHWSLTLLGIGLIIAFAYYGESVLSVLFFSILLSFMLSPLVQAGEYLHIPRGLAALLSLRMPGSEVSLDNPQSTRIPFGVAMALTVVFYAIGRAIGFGNL